MPDRGGAPDVRAIVRSDPAIMGGEPCFRGTRIPVSVLFGNLEAGLSLDEILASYPTLDRDDVLAVLREARRPQ
jgi:uncharacterized protein (DUF433 family)